MNFINSTGHTFKLTKISTKLYTTDSGAVEVAESSLYPRTDIQETWSFRMELSHDREDNFWLSLGIQPSKSKDLKTRYTAQCFALDLLGNLTTLTDQSAPFKAYDDYIHLGNCIRRRGRDDFCGILHEASDEVYIMVQVKILSN